MRISFLGCTSTSSANRKAYHDNCYRHRRSRERPIGGGAGGRFGSTLENYLDVHFRNDTEGDTFYAKILREEGQVAAEARLQKWAKFNHDHRVADALTPIVLSLSQLLEVKHRNISAVLFSKTDRSFFPFPVLSSQLSYGIAVYNPQVSGFGCAKGYEKFSMYGDLGITSFVVVIDPLRPQNNSFVMMLPILDRKNGNENKRGFVAVAMSRDGSISSEMRELYLYSNAAEHLAFGGDRAYGIKFDSGGSPCDYVGFPGAQEFIASSLIDLPEYLSGIAGMLSKEHGR